MFTARLPTATVRTCCATAPTPLAALTVTVNVPAVPDAGVPDSTPVDVLNESPLGSVPVRESAGAGYPRVVTWNVPPTPSVNWSGRADLVKDGASRIGQR